MIKVVHIDDRCQYINVWYGTKKFRLLYTWNPIRPVAGQILRSKFVGSGSPKDEKK
jgi:hypothetical protein